MKEDIKKSVSLVAGEEQAEDQAGDFVQLIAFNLDNEEYAVPIVDLQEVIPATRVTPVPNSPIFISGILNLRGKIVVVIDLEKRFNLLREEKALPAHIVIVSADDNTFGVLVDKVTEVLRVSGEAVKPPPSLVSSKINADYVEGVIVLSGREKEGGESPPRLIILLDIKKLLREEELLKFGNAVREATDKE